MNERSSPASSIGGTTLIVALSLTWLAADGLACSGGKTTGTTASSSTSATSTTTGSTTGSGGAGGNLGFGGNTATGGSAPGSIKQIAASQNFGCIVDSTNTACCFGDNSQGQLGTGDTLAVMGAKVLKGLENNVSRIALGVSAGCAQTLDGKLWCWGDNQQGAVGVGNNTSPLPPTQVTAFPQGVKDVSFSVTGYSTLPGGDFVIALTNDGSTWAWGANDYGQLGIGMSGPSVPSPMLQGLTGIAAVAMPCARATDLSVYCWGYNKHGEVGNGMALNPFIVLTPDKVVFPDQAVVELTGGFFNNCAAKNDNTVWCWGSNEYGGDGDGKLNNPQEVPTPVQVVGLGNGGIASLHAGGYFVCALAKDGSVWCWGAGDKGQLGNGGTALSDVAVQVPSLSNVVELSTAFDSACARKQDDSILCWGDFGAFGGASKHLVPTMIPSFACADHLKPPL